MKAFEFIAAPQRSAKWLELRKQGIGGSDVAAIMGVSPYKSRLQLYLEKRGELEEQSVGPAAMRGVLLEDAVAKMYEHDRPGTKLRSWHGIIRKKSEPWKYASLDRTIVGEKRIVEIKTSSSPRWSLYPIPPEVEAQVRWQMIVSGYRVADVAALLGGLVMRIETIEWDDEKHERIEAEVEAFWDDVQTGNRPAVAPLDSEVLDRVFPADRGESLIAETHEENLLLESYMAARKHVKFSEERVAQLEAELKEIMKDATQLIGNTQVATWRTTKERRSIDWESIARSTLSSSELDIAINNHERVSAGSRRFVVKERTHE